MAPATTTSTAAGASRTSPSTQKATAMTAPVMNEPRLRLKNFSPKCSASMRSHSSRVLCTPGLYSLPMVTGRPGAGSMSEIGFSPGSHSSSLPVRSMSYTPPCSRIFRKPRAPRSSSAAAKHLLSKPMRSR